MGAKIGVLLNCGQQSQFSKVRREFDAGRVNLDPPMTCADWPVPGNLTLLHTETAYTGKFYILQWVPYTIKHMLGYQNRLSMPICWIVISNYVLRKYFGGHLGL